MDSATKRVPTLSLGSKIEVSSDEEGLKGAWFVATIVESPSKSGSKKKSHNNNNNSDRVFVEYQTLVTDDDVPKPLREHVNVALIRPSPPPADADSPISFELNSVVDAFYKDGWWTGVITQLLDNSRFIVSFPNPPDVIEFGLSDLRIHREWINGKWVKSGKQDVLIPLIDQERGDTCNSPTQRAIPESSCHREEDSQDIIQVKSQIEQSLPANDRSSRDTLKGKRLKQASCDIDASPLQALKMLKEEKSAQTASENNTILTQTPNKETPSGYANPTPGDTGTNGLKTTIAADQPFANGGSLSWGKTQRREQNTDEGNRSTGSVTKRGRKTKSLVKSIHPSTEGINRVEEFVEECITKEIDIPDITGLEHNGKKGSEAKKPCHSLSERIRNQKKQLSDPGKRKITESDNSGVVVEEESPKRKRGRPSKLPIKRPEASVKRPAASVADTVQNRDAVPEDDIVAKKCISSGSKTTITVTTGPMGKKCSRLTREYLKLFGDDNESMSDPGKRRNILSTPKMTPSRNEKLAQEKAVQPSSTKQVVKHHASRKGSGDAALDIVSPVQDSHDTTPRGQGAEIIDAGPRMKRIEMAIEELPNIIADDQPLSMWLGGMPAIDGGSRKYIDVQCPHPIGVSGEFLTYSNPRLPFEKNFPLWETIEAMEVFKWIPQKPHFRGLENCKESSREGLAIGYMVTFSSVVEKTSNMLFDDPRSVIEDNLETLVELEHHGFDVAKVRDRLTGLLLMKDHQERLDGKTMEYEGRMMEHKRERTRLDNEIDEINKELRELEEARSRIMSGKMKKDKEVAHLEAKAWNIRKDMMCVEQEFEELTKAPW